MFATVDESIRQQRLTICNSCEKFSANFCTNCKCYMPAKTSFAKTNCPEGKWTEADPGESVINMIETKFLESWDKL